MNKEEIEKIADKFMEEFGEDLQLVFDTEDANGYTRGRREALEEVKLKLLEEVWTCYDPTKIGVICQDVMISIISELKGADK